MFPDPEFAAGVRKALADRVGKAFDLLISEWQSRTTPAERKKAVKDFTDRLHAYQECLVEAMKVIGSK